MAGHLADVSQLQFGLCAAEKADARRGAGRSCRPDTRCHHRRARRLRRRPPLTPRNARADHCLSRGPRVPAQYARPDPSDHATGAETKPAFKTTEFFVFLAGAVAIVITAVTVDGDASTGGDPFDAEQALRYTTFLAIGYMISRGLAKAGVRQRAGDRR